MTLRPVAPLELHDVVVGALKGQVPALHFVAPTALLVDESYQRTLSRRSIELIRGMVTAWDWTAYKPPTVVRDGEQLHVVDGQHTAIAAATRGDLPVIPVMIVEAAAIADRAGAFVKINSDRLAVTDIQLHHAKALAGDEDAVTINQVCERAGARIVWTLKQVKYYEVGDISAIGAVRQLIKRRFALGARRVLEVCVKAKCAPITRQAMFAVDALLFDPTYGKPNEGDIATFLRVPRTIISADRLAETEGITQWLALAKTIHRFVRGGSGGRIGAA